MELPFNEAADSDGYVRRAIIDDVGLVGAIRPPESAFGRVRNHGYWDVHRDTHDDPAQDGQGEEGSMSRGKKNGRGNGKTKDSETSVVWTRQHSGPVIETSEAVAELIFRMCQVLISGDEKYGVGTYMDIPLEKFLGALNRHLGSHLKGDFMDPETHLPHIAHAMANLVLIARKTLP